MSFESNDEPTPLKDPVLLLGLLQGWGFDNLDFTSLAPRVLHQCAKLHAFAQQSQGQLQVIRYNEDLVAYHDQRAKFQLQHPDIALPFTAGYLGIEGLQALDGQLSNIDVFFDAGVRTMGLAHFYDNPVAGSQHGRAKGGLTDLGRAVLKRMNELHIFIDLAHASSQTISDVCELYQDDTHPLIVSHAGVSALCNNNRNLNDEQLKCIGRTGGIVAIAFFRPAICGHDEIKAIVAAIKHVRDLIGVQHVGLGSDFDGSVTVPFDVSKLVYLADGLLNVGFSEDEIHAVLGGNQLRLFKKYLPSKQIERQINSNL